MKLRLWNSLEMAYKPEIKKNFMKAWHFLQVSSEIIAKHRHRSDVTGMTTSTRRRYLELKRATCATLGFIFAQVLTVDEMIRKISVATRSAVAL
jgi:hypothetical protein